MSERVFNIDWLDEDCGVVWDEQISADSIWEVLNILSEREINTLRSW